MNDEDALFSREEIAGVFGETPPAKQTSTTPPQTLVVSGRLTDDYKALGVAVTQMMADPSFARLGFGHWSRTLAGMINRKHYLIASEGSQITGFIGWALTNEKAAEQWLAGKGEISYEDSLEGDCVLINAWLAKTRNTSRHLLQEIRKFGADRRLVYFKRFYPDGRMRPMRLEVTEFVGRHAARSN